MADWERKQAAFFRAFDMDPDNLPDETPIADLKAASRSVQMIRPPRDYAPPDAGFLGYSDPIPAVDLGAEGLYCLEPFHTFYIRRDLDVKPCCNALAPTNLGNVRKDDAEAIWHGEGFRETRDQILNGQYPKMCHGCVKGGNAHADHHFRDDVEEYMVWYQRVFGAEFRKNTDDLLALGGGADIARRHREARNPPPPEPPPVKPPWVKGALGKLSGWFDRSTPLPELTD